MMHLSIAKIASITAGELVNTECSETEVAGVSIDTRMLQPGMLFVAFKGEQVDGHDFLDAAQKSGAIAALVEHQVDSSLTQIVVANVHQALIRLAEYWRAQFDLLVIGITGSNGKTTVKEMLAAVLASTGIRALVTSGNRNNELGLPLMLLELDQRHQVAVLEMGAGQPGDIRLLAELAKPDIGVITHIGPAHLERLGSLEGVARVKSELFQQLPTDGLAIFPQQAMHATILQSAATCELQSFGSSKDSRRDQQPLADTHWQAADSGMRLDTSAGNLSIELQVPGEHNCNNAAAAASVAVALGVQLEHIAIGLGSYRGYRGRLQRKAGIRGSIIIDDSYNANPASLIAALQVVAETDQQRERWLAMGDMGELGEQGPDLHLNAGEQARASGITRLFATGELSRQAVIGFGEGAQHFTDKAAMIETLRKQIHAQVSVLVKGSRAAQMEQVVDALTVAAQEVGTANEKIDAQSHAGGETDTAINQQFTNSTQAKTRLQTFQAALNAAVISGGRF